MVSKNILKQLFWAIEDLHWNWRCRYGLWLHGPYGLTKVIEQMPFKFIAKYLRKYGANIGEDCVIERGLILHRPSRSKIFKNLVIGNRVYLGHNVLIDLSDIVSFDDDSKIGACVQIWTHTGFFKKSNADERQYVEDIGKVKIGKAAIVYSGTIISQGVVIGEYSSVGANSLVIKNVDAQCFFAGVPAKNISQKAE